MNGSGMSSMHIVLATAFGSAIGGGLRAAVGLWFGATSWPAATFVVNVVGSFVLGVVMGAPTLREPWRWLLGAGVCGGLTTFSTLALELVRGADSGRGATQFAYLLLTVVLGCGCLWLGMRIGRGTV
jgi:fluoride exporter